MSKLIRGKVARVLNSREIVITVGSENGVKIGMQFEVLDRKGEDIKDPDSGELLGSIKMPKVRVKVVQIQKRISVASTFRKKKINVGGTGAFIDFGQISRVLLPPKFITQRETLKIDEDTWEDLDQERSYVKTGDPVVQVVEEAELVETEEAVS